MAVTNLTWLHFKKHTTIYGKNHVTSVNLGSIAKGGKADVNVTVENIIKKLV